MDSQSTSRSGIGIALQQLGADTSITNAGDEKPLSPRGGRNRSVSEARTFSHWPLGRDEAAERTPEINVNGIDTLSAGNLTSSPTKDSVFNDFCRGQPPRRSFLASDGQTLHRLLMSRRSTLADKPELDTLLRSAMVRYKDEDFLPLDFKTVHHLARYFNGSKPLAHTCRLKRLLITSETNQGQAGPFVAAIENVGVYCEHLAIVAPFHTIDFSNVFDRDTGNLEPGSDWEKILQCFPNLHTLTFEHPVNEPTNLTRDTFCALNRALANNTTVQKIKDFKLYVPPKVVFDYHREFHNNQRREYSLDRVGVIWSPLTIVCSGIVYTDGIEDFGQREYEAVFGEVDVDTVDG